MGSRVRVLGTQRPLSGSPVSAWAYRAELNDENGTAYWSCQHDHPTPQLAYVCGAEVLRRLEASEESAPRPAVDETR